MNKRKIFGIIIALIGLILVAGSVSSDYGIIASVTMSFIVIIGLAMIFWDKVKSWFSK